MTAPPRPDPALLAEIGLLRRRIAALEDDAGSDPSPERRLEADRVRQSIAVLRGIMRNLLIGFAVVNPRGEIVDANDAFARLLGYTRKELLDARLTWKQITPPGFEAADRKARETLRSTGAPYTYRKEYLRRDDSRVPVTLCVLYTTDLRDDHALFVLDDSARRKSELDQEQAERIYRSVLDAIPDLVVLADPAAQVVWANRAFLAFYGVTLPEITGRFGPASWPPAVLETVLRDRALVLETGMTLDRSLQERTRSDGQTRVLHVMTAPILDAAGRVVRTVSIARDVTERARDDAALLRSEAHLRTAQALARAGSYECDVPYRGNDIWSEQMYEILGLPREGPPRPVMECIEELTHPDDLVRAREAVLRALAEGGRLDVVFRNRLPDGTTRLIRSIGEVVHGPDGLQKRIVGTLLDVTAEQERRTAQAALEARLRQAQKLEAVATLAQAVARDLDGILATISRHTDSAREAAKANGNPRLLEDLGHVLSAAERASNLVSRLLIFGRHQRPRGARLRLAGVIGEALDLVRPALPAGVEVRATLEADTPEVRGDETQMVQLALNLLTNAIHALEGRGGTLTVRLEPLEVDAELAQIRPALRPGRHARLTVSDTGCGIAPEHLERVIEPFFTTKAPGRGTGLGLSVVHGIVRDHGGDLEIASRPGEGTTVRIDLPAFEPSHGEGRGAEHPKSDPGPPAPGAA